MEVMIFSGKCCLGTLFPCYPELLWSEESRPFLIGFNDGGDFLYFPAGCIENRDFFLLLCSAITIDPAMQAK
jgi:hypothetical protein